MVFWPPFGLNNEYGGNFKGGTAPHCTLYLWGGGGGGSSPGKQVGRSSTPCRKRSQVWGRESERLPKYMQQRHQCWKREEF